MVREGRDISGVDPIAGEPRVKTHAVGHGQPVVRDFMNEWMVKTEARLDRSEVAQLREMAERRRNTGEFSPSEEGGSAHVEHLACDRGVLQQVAVGGRQLVQPRTDRALNRDGNVVPLGRTGPRELDHEERVAFRAEGRALIGRSGTQG